MIEYVEIRSAASREMIGIIDTAKSIIWHEKYYGVGDFELYLPCTPEAVELLSVGNYVTRYDARSVGIIERREITYTDSEGRMIVAAGRFAKSLLDRRIIFRKTGNSVSPTILSGNVEAAARKLVTENAVSCAFDTGRNIPELALGGLVGASAVIVDDSGNAAQKQVTHDGLLEYTDAMLEEYGLGAFVGLDNSLKLSYTIAEGADRSVDNTAGNEPVIFSQDFDNLVSSAHAYDESTHKNTALIGGEGEGEERFYAEVKNSAVTGLERREIFVDSSSVKRTYKDENETEITLTDAEYSAQLQTAGQQTLGGLQIVETFDGSLDLNNSAFVYGRDFALGDIVTVQDVEIGLYINPRILEVTEVQDDSGYNIDAVYGK